MGAEKRTFLTNQPSGAKKLEANKARTQRALFETAEMKRLRADIQRVTKWDFVTEARKGAAGKFDVLKEGFDWNKVAKKLRETNVGSTLPQLMRAGVQMVANSAYENYDTTYEQWTTVVNSTKDTELYAPIQGLSFPNRVGKQEKYPELQMAGLDISITNEKFGDILPIEYELYEDDQTGQTAQQAGTMGEYMKLLIEVACYGKLASVSNMSYANFEMEPTATKPTNEGAGVTYPWTTQANALIGGGFTRPNTFAVLDQTSLQAGIIALQNQKNLLGIKMPVKGNRIISGTRYQFSTSILLNSAFYPSGAAAAGAVGGAFAINPLKGIADYTVSPFIVGNTGAVDTGTTSAWWLVDDSKPWFVVQLREALMIEQEAPNSGESFNRDVIRYKARMRGNFDFIDPRFAWQGNNGSVTS